MPTLWFDRLLYCLPLIVFPLLWVPLVLFSELTQLLRIDPVTVTYRARDWRSSLVAGSFTIAVTRGSCRACCTWIFNSMLLLFTSENMCLLLSVNWHTQFDSGHCPVFQPVTSVHCCIASTLMSLWIHEMNPVMSSTGWIYQHPSHADTATAAIQLKWWHLALFIPWFKVDGRIVSCKSVHGHDSSIQSCSTNDTSWHLCDWTAVSSAELCTVFGFSHHQTICSVVSCCACVIVCVCAVSGCWSGFFTGSMWSAFSEMVLDAIQHHMSLCLVCL